MLQKILSKIDKVHKKENNQIELSSDFSDFNKMDKLIETQNEKNIVINDDSIDKENLMEYNNNTEREKEFIELPRLHLFDYLMNNLYISKKCCCNYNKQMLIKTANEILGKYCSIESILYNQIKLENLFKDYRWNNPGLRSINHNELVEKLRNNLLNT